MGIGQTVSKTANPLCCSRARKAKFDESQPRDDARTVSSLHASHEHALSGTYSSCNIVSSDTDPRTFAWRRRWSAVVERDIQHVLISVFQDRLVFLCRKYDDVERKTRIGWRSCALGEKSVRQEVGVSVGCHLSYI